MVDDLGANVLALADRLAAWSETGMSASIDAVGNVVGRYAAARRAR
jgi:hypothetical protein